MENMSALIESVFFAEFDNIVGPKITYQVPANFFSTEQFGAIETFIITGPELCNRIITLCVFFLSSQFPVLSIVFSFVGFVSFSGRHSATKLLAFLFASKAPSITAMP